MAHYWLIISLWFGTASLQYINTASPASDGMLDPLDYLHRSSPYGNYFNLPSARNEFESFQNDANVPHDARYYEQEQTDLQRKRRTIEEDRQEDITDRRWEPNLDDLDKTLYLRNDEKDEGSFIDHNARTEEESNTEKDVMNADKRSFSPWGGKRGDKTSIEHMWTWKRAQNIREPSMPKRVRFSPWGGKRSGQMIYKPGAKGAKVIFSASVPELTRIVSNYSPNDKLNLAGFQFVPALDKRHPIKFLALSTKADDRVLRDELPFKAFIQSLPRLFKPGHTYSDINLKKDGKRKVKFSAWGGKRSPPIIGPIWTPAPQDVKESTLDSIVLIRNSQNNEDSKAL
ncbi:uncharacterized protein [Epargyreus clarus]|uniref:uncharacterized protein n=1 Tax=Epargyreus clarus TaxID=520877 RepID=UPI003C2E4353